MDELRKNCPMRNKDNGNCSVIGGFCTAVNDPICTGLHNAYDCGFREGAAASIQATREKVAGHVAAPSVGYKPGDVCLYSFGEKNGSRAIVRIVKIKDDPRGVAEVKFLKVLVDDSGNGYFNFLCRTGNTMNASLKYLEKTNWDGGESK